eukprot:TRINITY_DN83573_c0_g1_i1.p1 TRINITY_DN83573_c0_g1~~TRINITY_DN83573_c0_g1_i1.p1  ORF type:complete len:314 (-),score=52.04 TRINITY_DN83573_c0_g1_i1:91-1032(-)
MAPKGRWGRKDKDGNRVEPAEAKPAALPSLPVRKHDFELRDAVCVLIENFFDIGECQKYLNVLMNEVDWKRQDVTLEHIAGANKTVAEPRRTIFMSDPGICYWYSGRDNVGAEWHPTVFEIKTRAERALVEECGMPPVVFNSVHLNRYDHPRHSLGMHADNEPDLVRDAPIVSISFGCARDFCILRRGNHADSALNVSLRDGSFLLMGGEMQQHYLHGIPVGGEKGQKGTRVNLTFRVCHRRRDGATSLGSGPPAGTGPPRGGPAGPVDASLGRGPPPGGFSGRGQWSRGGYTSSDAPRAPYPDRISSDDAWD